LQQEIQLTQILSTFRYQEIRSHLLQQQGYDAAYKDWMSQLQMPMQLMGGLSAMMPQISQLYSPNTTQTTGFAAKLFTTF
jgi:hypothetical protein